MFTRPVPAGRVRGTDPPASAGRPP